MRTNPNELIYKLSNLDASLSQFCTIAEGVIDWNKVPNSELKILEERVKVIQAAVDDLYRRTEDYAHR